MAIVEANRELLDRLPPPVGANGRKLTRFLPGEEHETCWACGWWIECEPERAHIVADAHGGPNHPSNYFLICSRCHEEQPDGAPRLVQEAWLATREHYTARRERESQQLSAALVWACAQAGIECVPIDYTDIDEIERFGALRRSMTPRSAGWLNGPANDRWHTITVFLAWLQTRPSKAQ